MSLLLALALAAGAAAEERLTRQQIEVCGNAASRGFKDFRRADLSRFEAPSNDLRAYPVELAVDFFVIGKRGFLSMDDDESELAEHLGWTREAFRPCGIEVALGVVRYVEAPEFLEEVERADDWRVPSQEEACMAGPLRRQGAVGVYFVQGVSSDVEAAVSHAVRALDAAIVSDHDRGWRSADGPNKRRPVVVAHEIAHIVLRASHESGREPNIMADELSKLALKLRPDQCEKARTSPFARPRSGL